MTDQRKAVLDGIRDTPRVPVLILGGGVNGVGLFRELALQGVDCLLVDKADFVAGASSKPTRMIHGGLRYLETRQVRLVRESLRERNLLLENAPHYVTPMRTTIPLFSRLGGLVKSTLAFLGFPVRPAGRGALLVRFGLWFYDFVIRKNRRTPRHFFTSKGASLRNIPGLHPDIIGTATYWDARITQAERLCIELIQDACASNPNCRAINYMRPETLEGGAIVLHDEASGERVPVRPRVVVNATGAWVDRANAALGLATELMGGTKGSHLVIHCPELHQALGDQMIYYEHTDGRVCIVFTFGDRVIMGSTDLRVDDPDEARCDDAEIDYMLTTLRGVFPDVRVGREDIVFAFCGVRPLPASRRSVVGAIPRGHSIRAIEPDAGRPFPVYCLIGGKWTTFRAFAEQTADQILARLGLERRCATDHLPIGGGRGYPPDGQQKAQWIERVARQAGLSADRIATLLDRYGTAAEAYAADARAETPLRTLPDYTAGEIQRIAATEWVVHLTDLLCRRSTIALLGRATPDAIAELAEVVGGVLGWDPARRRDEVRLALDDVRVAAPPSASA